MSYSWENVIWQSRDGSWNRGYFKRELPGSFDYNPDRDEYADDYDMDQFMSVITKVSYDEAGRFTGPFGNAGGAWEIEYKGNSSECKNYDRMAEEFKDPSKREKRLKSERLRRNREHFKKLAEEFPEEKLDEVLRTGAHLTIEVKSGHDAEANIGEYSGLFTTLSGQLKEDGDWILLGAQRLYNRKTGKFAKNLYSIAAVKPRIGYGYRY